MQKWFLILIGLIVTAMPSHAQLQLGPIGTWRAHFSNESIQQVIKGDQLYVVAANQIIQIDAKKQTTYLNTTTGLHAIGIHKIAWHPIENQLVIAYKNSRVDIVQGDQVTLIDDIQTSNLYADKAINDLIVFNNKAYLSCNFGIVVIDLLKKEIKATYFPNNNRQTVKVLQTIIYQNKLFALTENGIWSNSVDQNNIWIQENTMGINGIQNMFVFKNQLYFNDQQKIYPYQNNVASYQITSGVIQTITVDEDRILAGIAYQNNGALIQFNSNQSNTVIIDSTILVKPVGLLKDGNTIWVADFAKGLYEKNDQSKWFALGGPLSAAYGSNAFSDHQLLMSYGASKIGLSSLNEKGWSNFSQLENIKINYVEAVSIDLKDQSWWIGMGNQLIHYDRNKKTIEQPIPNPPIGNIKSIQQKSDGTIAVLKEGFGVVLKEGNPAIIEDKDGSIWVGTDNGIAIFQCTNINEVCDAYLPIVQSNGFNGYLFQKETIHSITIDGANRKWIGTNNGAWLISKDGTEVLQHFTTENSPLPDNTVLSIGIEPSDGDVFFFTKNEIISYKGNSTEPSTTQSAIKIYPNPIGPNYNGPIVIKNLVNNALVKITDINGQLMMQTRALGGQAIWNGRDQYQHKVASGIYLIFVRDDMGNEKAVGKILISAGY